MEIQVVWVAGQKKQHVQEFFAVVSAMKFHYVNRCFAWRCSVS